MSGYLALDRLHACAVKRQAVCCCRRAQHARGALGRVQLQQLAHLAVGVQLDHIDALVRRDEVVSVVVIGRARRRR